MKARDILANRLFTALDPDSTCAPEEDIIGPAKKAIDNIVHAISAMQPVYAKLRKENPKFEINSSDEISIDVADIKNQTALFMAVNRNHIKILELLLEAKADPDRPSSIRISYESVKYTTPLLHAADKDYLEVGRLLLKSGASPNIHFPDKKDTPLHIASRNGYTEFVRLLLTYQADVNMQNKYNDTPLADACDTTTCNTEIVRALLAANADPNLIDNSEKTPLMYAAKHGHTDILVLLLQSGKIRTLDKKDKEGETVLDHAIKSKNLSTVHVLLKYGAPFSSSIDAFLATQDQHDPLVYECFKILASPPYSKSHPESHQFYMNKLKMLHSAYTTYCSSFVPPSLKFPKPVADIMFNYDGRFFKGGNTIQVDQPKTVDASLDELKVDILTTGDFPEKVDTLFDIERTLDTEMSTPATSERKMP